MARSDQFRVFDGPSTLVQRNLNEFYEKGYRLREWAVSQDGSRVVALMELDYAASSRANSTIPRGEW